jgi:hypothetical protein
MWTLFGGTQPFRMVLAGLNVDGRLEVFGLAEDDSVWHNLQMTPSVDDWTGWSPFGRSDLPGRSAGAGVSGPEAWVV